MFLHVWLFRCSHSDYNFLLLKGYWVKCPSILRGLGTVWRRVIVFAFYNPPGLLCLVGTSLPPQPVICPSSGAGSTLCLSLLCSSTPASASQAARLELWWERGLHWVCWISGLTVRWSQMCQINQGQLFVKLNNVLGRCFVDKVPHTVNFLFCV